MHIYLIIVMHIYLIIVMHIYLIIVMHIYLIIVMLCPKVGARKKAWYCKPNTENGRFFVLNCGIDCSETWRMCSLVQLVGGAKIMAFSNYLNTPSPPKKTHEKTGYVHRPFTFRSVGLCAQEIEQRAWVRWPGYYRVLIACLVPSSRTDRKSSSTPLPQHHHRLEQPAWGCGHSSYWPSSIFSPASPNAFKPYPPPPLPPYLPSPPSSLSPPTPCF